MELRHIDIAHLSVSALNMRSGRKAPDISDILPSIRARGVLVPLIVRETGDERYEIVAGRRRYHAALAVAEDAGGIDPLPCAVMAAGDDAAALEASIIENVARLDPDEVSQWESFVRLVKQGRTSADIAATFGLTELQVKRTLALGNLVPRIRTLYRAERIDAATVRHLTLASKARQKEWLALVDDESSRAPVGSQLKAWLFGGASIPVGAALFDLSSYSGEIVGDLFGEERWFGNASDFWTAQNEVIESRVQAYREGGWSDVIVLPQGEVFHSWTYERTPKRNGGKVYVTVSHRGEVSFHEGYVSRAEIRRQEKASEPKPQRPEISAPLRNYIDLHRHAAMRVKLLDSPGVALRAMVATAICGSPLWTVQIEPQRAHNEQIAESIETCSSEAIFDKTRRAVLALLGFDAEAPTVVRGQDGDAASLFQRLLTLSDDRLLDVIAIVMGETLDAGGAMVEPLGQHLGLDMADVWQADDALLDHVRDREVLDAMVAEVAGDTAAKANASATAKVKRRIIRDCLTGANGRSKVERWVPRWMRFPAGSYREQAEPERIAADQPEPLAQAA